jgi:hypothetical protein
MLDKIDAMLKRHEERQAEATKRADRLKELRSMYISTADKLAKIEKETEDHCDGMESIYGDSDEEHLKFKMA